MDKIEHIQKKNSKFINFANNKQLTEPINNKFKYFNILNKLSPKSFLALFDNQQSTFEQHSKFKNGAKFY